MSLALPSAQTELPAVSDLRAQPVPAGVREGELDDGEGTGKVGIH